MKKVILTEKIPIKFRLENIQEVTLQQAKNLANHKIFFHEEFFGSRIYNTKNQKEYFFDKDSTVKIKKSFLSIIKTIQS